MSKHKPLFEKDHRVAVVGAGPAGIHMASLLKKYGYSNVTVLERSDRIGGKSYTQIRDGVPYEVGTCCLHNGYIRIKKLIQDYGLRKAIGIDPGGKNTSIFLDKNEMIDDSKSLELHKYMTKVICKNMREKQPKWRWFPEWIVKTNLLKAIWDYNQLYQQLFGTSKLPYAIPLHLRTEVLEQIDISLLDFLKKHRLEALIGFLQLAQTAQGYGYLETIPAYYGLCWITPELLVGLIKEMSGLEPLIQMLPDGYETLWQTIATKDSLNIKLETTIQSINRSALDNTITIETKNSAGELQLETYDFLILTINLKNALRLLEDATETEQRLFNVLKGFTLTSTLYESEPVAGYSTADYDKVVVYFPDVLASGRDNEWYADRNDRHIFAKAVGVEKCFGRQRRIAFQFSEQELPIEDIENHLFTQNTKIRSQLVASWAKKGIKNPTIIEQFSWPYFMHFPGWAIRQGYTNELWKKQGHCKTWYAGASACFESVNHVVNYNHALVETYL